RTCFDFSDGLAVVFRMAREHGCMREREHPNAWFPLELGTGHECLAVALGSGAEVEIRPNEVMIGCFLRRLGHCIERLPCMRVIRSAPLDSCILQPGPQLRGHNQIVELMAPEPSLAT